MTADLDTLFISDLHLSPARPEMVELFKRLLRGPARKARALYILGDLFEQFWAGNDDMTPPNPGIIAELLALTSAGVACSMLRGNRELMLDDGFALLTGCQVIPDRTVIELDKTPFLLMHGDRLCTRDVAYQAFRLSVENPVSKGVYGALPHGLRIRLAHGIRPAMVKHAETKAPEIIDVDQKTVEKTMRKYHVTDLIHGHTHRPNVHQFELDGFAARRIVLGDWYRKPRMLVSRDGKQRLVEVAEYCAAA